MAKEREAGKPGRGRTGRVARHSAPSRARRPGGGALPPATPVWRDGQIRSLDALDDPRAWIAVTTAFCRLVWERSGLRYARRLHEQERRRDPLRDVAALAARRSVPLTRTLTRPLPLEGLSAEQRGFNGLDPADRRVLGQWDVGTACRGARAEHVASALHRLLASVEAQERADRKA